MPKHPLLLLALVLNILILAPVVSGLLFGFPYETDNLGPLTEGRLILTTMYSSIAIVSAGLIIMHFKALEWAVPMTVALFAVQITYKVQTVPLVGLSNPVVIANVFVVIVQAIALFALWRSSRQSLKQLSTA